MALVLAIESDAEQSDALNRIARERTEAELVLVDSKAAAVAAIDSRLPDLILLSALFSPRDEKELIAHLRQLPDAAHLQTLTIPRLQHAETKRSRRRLFSRKRAAPKTGACDPSVFAAQIVAYLERARELQIEAEQRKAYPRETTACNTATGAVPSPAESSGTALDSAEATAEQAAGSDDEGWSWTPHDMPTVLEAVAIGESALRHQAEDSSANVEWAHREAESQLATELERVRAEAEEGRHAQLEAALSEAETLRTEAEEAARRAANTEAEAAETMAAELSRAREETERAFAAELSRVRTEADQTLALELNKARIEAEEARLNELARVQEETDALKSRAEGQSDGVDQAVAAAVEAEVRRVRADAEVRLTAERERANARLSEARLADMADALRETAAREAKTVAEAEALRVLEQQISRVRAEATEKLVTELKRVREEADAARAAELVELRTQMAELRAKTTARARRDGDRVDPAAEPTDAPIAATARMGRRLGAWIRTLIWHDRATDRAARDDASDACPHDAPVTETESVASEATAPVAPLRRTMSPFGPRPAERSTRSDEEPRRAAERDMMTPGPTKIPETPRATMTDGAWQTAHPKASELPEPVTAAVPTGLPEAGSAGEAPLVAMADDVAAEGHGMRDYYSLWRKETVARKRVVATTEETPRPRRRRWALAFAAGLVIVLVDGLVRNTASYEATQAEIAMAADTVQAGLPIVAVPSLPLGGLQVESSPADARVLVDGEERGRTPLTISELPAGPHRVRLESSAGTVRRTVTVSEGRTAAIVETIIPGWLAVFSRERLEVFANGRRLGSSEDGHLMLPPSRYEIKLVNRSRGVSVTHQIEIEPGEVTPHNVQLDGATMVLINGPSRASLGGESARLFGARETEQVGEKLVGAGGAGR